MLVDAGILDWDPTQQDEENFNTDAYLAGQYTGKVKNGKKDLSKGGDGMRNIRMEDGILLPSYRLPTEAEWEYAARGGSESQQFRYAGSDNPDDVAWYAENSGGTTHDVGLKFPNTTEVNDMSGNVSEWVQDNYNEYSSYPQTNPCVSKESEVHVIRGGSYLSDVRSIRVTARDGEKASYRSPAVGLRLAVSL